MRHEKLGIVSLLLLFVVLAWAATGSVVNATRGLAVAVDPSPRASRAPASRVAATTAVQVPEAIEAALRLDRDARRRVQQGLQNEGFDPGPPDGLFGPRTREAIRRWQEAREVPPTGYLDRAGIELLLGASTVSGGSTLPVSQAAASSSPVVAERAASPTPAVIVPADVRASREREPGSAESPTATQAPVPAQLPPEIFVDRHLVRVERLLAAGNHREAHAVLQQVIALREEHALTLPDEFAFRYAQVAFGAGLTEDAISSLNEYLLETGRQGTLYREALELLDSARGGPPACR